MRRRFLTAFAGWALVRPGFLLALAGLAAVFSLTLATQLEMRTARSELSPPDDPETARLRTLRDEFANPDPLFVLLSRREDRSPSSGDTLDSLEPFALRLAEALTRRGDLVGRVDASLDLDFFGERGLWLEEPERIETLAVALEAIVPPLQPVGHLDDLNRMLAAVLREARRRADTGDGPGEGVAWLARLLEAERDLLQDPGVGETLIPEDPFAQRLAETFHLSPGGLLASSDGQCLVLVVTPSRDSDRPAYLRRLVDLVRREADRLGAAEEGLTVELTGQPAIIVEEADAVGRDTGVTALIAAVGVTLLAAFSFRRRRRSLVVLVALLFGVAWTFGVVAITIGYLNLITSSFVAIVLGLGIDFGIHLISEYEMERDEGADTLDALAGALRVVGPGLLTGGFTTAVAFFSILVMDFRGFAELGFVAGTGVLLCLLAVLTVMPAILLARGLPWRTGPSRGDRHALLDRFWGRRIIRGLLAAPLLTAVGGAGLLILLGIAGHAIRMDVDLQALMPADSPAVRTQQRLTSKTRFTTDLLASMAPDLETLAARRERAVRSRAIGGSESLLDLLPADRPRSAAALERLSEALDRIQVDAGTTPRFDRRRTREGLLDLEELLREAADDAFATGLARTAGDLERARGAAEVAAISLRGDDPDRDTALARTEARLARRASRLLARLRTMARASPFGPGDLPPLLRERFVGRNGRFLLLLYPAGEIRSRPDLESFVGEARGVDSEAAGYPSALLHTTERIFEGFGWALALGLLSILVILVVDLRRPLAVILALVPLAGSLATMIGLMALSGLSFNLANLIAVPLIVGISIDSGVHLLHRARIEGPGRVYRVLERTGRAILVSTLTTMVGFGSLALASHRGMASLGLVLLFGAAGNLFTSMVLLPALLALRDRLHGFPQKVPS